MQFGGLLKLTLLDYPGKVACTLFTKGCNFYCPFCHNSYLVEHPELAEDISEEEVLKYLEKRKGILDGVCISGGEPLLHTELAAFIQKIKDMGYFVKLDTNGSFPERLCELVKKHLVDYVAMDIKNCSTRYRETAGCDVSMEKVEESIDFLLSGIVDYEFRTTVVKELHTVEDIEAIAKRISGAKKYYLQNFVDSGHIIANSLHFVDDCVLEQMEKAAQKYVKTASIRGKS